MRSSRVIMLGKSEVHRVIAEKFFLGGTTVNVVKQRILVQRNLWGYSDYDIFFQKCPAIDLVV